MIVDRPGDLDPLDISLLKGILDNSNRTMVLSPSLEKDTSDSLLGGKRLKFPVESSHVHMGEFPKSMDEIKEAVKLVKSLLSEENTPIDIGIAAPNDYLEVLSALLGESGIPSSYRFNVPVKGNPAHEAFELILKVSSETATLTDALALLKNPLVRIGDDSGQYVKMKHYFSAFI